MQQYEPWHRLDSCCKVEMEDGLLDLLVLPDWALGRGPEWDLVVDEGFEAGDGAVLAVSSAYADDVVAPSEDFQDRRQNPQVCLAFLIPQYPPEFIRTNDKENSDDEKSRIRIEM